MAMENRAEPQAMSMAAYQGTWAGTEAHAPSARMPKNGPLGFSRTRSEYTEPTPARVASTATSHQEWMWLTDSATPTATPVSSTSAAWAWWRSRSWCGSERPYMPG